MDAGLITLGVIVLFGAGVLFKSTGMLGGFQSDGKPPKPEAHPVTSPTQPALGFETPATVGRGELRVCRNCLSECSVEAEFCPNCGKKIIRPKDLNISKEQRKWFRQFNWTHNPFTPDVIPSLFTGYKEQVDEILKKVSLRSGNILVLGDYGTGKTTLLRWLELNLPDSFFPIYVFWPPDQFSELVDVVAYSLDQGKGVKPGEYNIYNIDKRVKRVNKSVLILIDEAHEFDFSMNKPLKTLGDIENVNIVLAGLPGLNDRITKEAPALSDRIVSRVELFNLVAEETEDLVVKRIENVGGWGHEPFTEDAIEEIYRITDGNPRDIIKLCDSAVTEATTSGILTIDAGTLREIGATAPVKKYVGKTQVKTPPKEARKPEKTKKMSDSPDLKSVVKERIQKLDRLYGEYVKTGNTDGLEEVVDIAKSTVSESSKRLSEEKLTDDEKQRLELMVDLFSDWLKKVEKKST